MKYGFSTAPIKAKETLILWNVIADYLTFARYDLAVNSFM